MAEWCEKWTIQHCRLEGSVTGLWGQASTQWVALPRQHSWACQWISALHRRRRWTAVMASWSMCMCILSRFSHVRLFLFEPMDCSPPGTSIHGILQARILEWVAMPSSRGSSQPRDQICISYVCCICRQVLYH